MVPVRSPLEVTVTKHHPGIGSGGIVPPPPGSLVSPKAGLIGLTKSLAREYAARKITVNAVAPGYVHTALTETMGEKARAVLLDRTPLARIGEAMEVAATVLFLASDEAGFITGEVINVSGGMLI